jgi:hypothetical protein
MLRAFTPHDLCIVLHFWLIYSVTLVDCTKEEAHTQSQKKSPEDPAEVCTMYAFRDNIKKSM